MAPDAQDTQDPRLPPIRVVLVEPMYEGNVGGVARVCANFGVDDLVLVQGPELTDRAGMMAVHADELLEEADRVDTLKQALQGAAYSVAFTAEISTNPKDHVRDAVELPDAAEKIRALEGTTALVFGREDDGLSLDELAALDLVTRIPVDPGYPSMNLSHAVAVGLYEVRARDRYPSVPEYQAASREELELLYDTFEHMMLESRFREHKIGPAMNCLRRVFGRARLSTWEYHRIMGVLTRALKQMDAWPDHQRFDDA